MLVSGILTATMFYGLFGQNIMSRKLQLYLENQ